MNGLSPDELAAQLSALRAMSSETWAHTLKWWLELSAALATIFAVPVALSIFRVEQTHRAVEDCTRRFHSVYSNALARTLIEQMMVAYLDLDRPWKTHRHIKGIIRDGFVLDGTSRGHSLRKATQSFDLHWPEIERDILENRRLGLLSKLRRFGLGRRR